MKIHGNSKNNDAIHHLYEILDGLEDDIYKYGISAEELNEDGSSPRANRQIKEFNRVVNAERFSAKVLLKKIRGRILAEKMEQIPEAILDE